MTHAVFGAYGFAMRSAKTWLVRRSWISVLAVLWIAALVALLAMDAVDGRRIFALAALLPGAAAVTIAAQLTAALHTAEKDTAELTAAYLNSQQEIADVERFYRSRLHDARSAAASARGAAGLLATPRLGRPAAQTAQLRLVLTAELDRMAALLDTKSAEQPTDFDLSAALAPILLAHRLAGLRLSSSVEELHVHGRAFATASVLDNLLRNVTVHARGASVLVQACRAGEFAVITVDDDGPGIPVAEWDVVLQPGVRGSSASAPGSGLGLHTAASAIAEQAGSMRVGRSPAGGTRVTFTLPVAAAVPLATAPRLAS